MVDILKYFRSGSKYNEEEFISLYKQALANAGISQESDDDDESSSVTLNSSTIIHDKVPESLNPAIQEAKNISFAIVHEINGVIILGSYSENSHHSVREKFGATNREEINLKHFKPDDCYKVNQFSGGSGRNVTNPPTTMAYSLEELTFIKNSIVNLPIFLPCTAGVYLITTCTKHWIKFYKLNSFDNIRKVATLEMLEKYFEDLARLNLDKNALTVIKRPRVSLEENSERANGHPANDSGIAFEFLTYKDNFVSKYTGKWSLSKVDQERACKLIVELIKCVHSEVLSYYFVLPSTATSKEINAAWKQLAKAPFARIMYPLIYAKRHHYKKHEYTEAIRIAVLKDMFAIINNLENHLSNPSNINGDQEAFVRFSEKWYSFKAALFKIKHDKPCVSTSAIAATNSQNQPVNSLGNINVSNTSGEVTRRAPLTNRLSNTISSSRWQVENFDLISHRQNLDRLNDIEHRLVNIENRFVTFENRFVLIEKQLFSSNSVATAGTDNQSILREIRSIKSMLQPRNSSTRHKANGKKKRLLKITKRSRTGTKISSNEGDTNDNESHQ